MKMVPFSWATTPSSSKNNKTCTHAHCLLASDLNQRLMSSYLLIFWFKCANGPEQWPSLLFDKFVNWSGLALLPLVRSFQLTYHPPIYSRQMLLWRTTQSTSCRFLTSMRRRWLSTHCSVIATNPGGSEDASWVSLKR